MFFRLPRLTPGYIRYLQTQAKHCMKETPKNVTMPRTAMVLGTVGIGMSGYSSRQLALYHTPSSRIMQWRDQSAAAGVAGVGAGGGSILPLASQGVFNTTAAAAAGLPACEQQQLFLPKLP